MREFENFFGRFDVHMSVHRKYISKVQQSSCNVLASYLFLSIALHVSGGFSSHHQEHKTVHTASGIYRSKQIEKTSKLFGCTLETFFGRIRRKI